MFSTSRIIGDPPDSGGKVTPDNQVAGRPLRLEWGSSVWRRPHPPDRISASDPDPQDHQQGRRRRRRPTPATKTTAAIKKTATTTTRTIPASPTPAAPPESVYTPAVFGARRRRHPPQAPNGAAKADTRLAGVPHQPDRFVGRVGVLTACHAALAPQSGRSGVLLHGMAGAGKTSIAVELIAAWNPTLALLAADAHGHPHATTRLRQQLDRSAERGWADRTERLRHLTANPDLDLCELTDGPRPVDTAIATRAHAALHRQVTINPAPTNSAHSSTPSPPTTTPPTRT